MDLEKALTVGELAKRSGVTVSALPQNRAPTAAEWRRLSSKWKDKLGAKGPGPRLLER